MRKIASLLLCLLFLSGCTAIKEGSKKQYTATFLNLFDTVTTIVGYGESEAAFKELVSPVRDKLEHYHRLFDIYNDYEGIVGLKTVNDKAHIAPVKVEADLLNMLEDAKTYYTATKGAFNPAMGSILRLWHRAREDSLNDPENAYLPNYEELKGAAEHIDPGKIVLDKEKSTVFIADPKLKLDVGGIAKGWAVERVAKTAPKGLLISVGGNVYSTGPKNTKNDRGDSWTVGIANPKGEGNIERLSISSGSVVTSGNYIRNFKVNGKLYHHIIDPKTLFPGENWISVTVVCEDSGLGDALSTALFLMDKNKGQELLDKFGALAMWIDSEENKYYSSGFESLIKT